LLYPAPRASQVWNSKSHLSCADPASGHHPGNGNLFVAYKETTL